MDQSDMTKRMHSEAIERIAERREARGEARGKRETMLATAKRMLKDGILALKDMQDIPASRSRRSRSFRRRWRKKPLHNFHGIEPPQHETANFWYNAHTFFLEACAL